MSASVQLLVRALCHSEGGVRGLEIYDDGVELVGSPRDADESAEFVHGEFDLAEVRGVFPNMPVEDNR